MRTIHLIVKTLIISCLILAGILVFPGSSEGPFLFLDFFTLVFVVLGTAAMTSMGFSFAETGAAFRHAFGGGDEQQGRENSVYFWEAAGRNAFMVGVLGTVTGFFIMIKNLLGFKWIGLSLATSFVSTFYGLILAAFCAVAALRAGKKLDGTSQPRPQAQAQGVKIENIVGYILFIAIIGWPLVKTGTLPLIIHWPSLLVVVGGAVLMVLWVGNGKDGRSITLGFAFTGLIGVVFGIVQMFYGMYTNSIGGIAAAMAFSILSCVFGLLGMMLGGIPLQDRAFKKGKIPQKITASRIAWYGFPALASGLLFIVFLLMLIPIKEG